MSATQPRPGSQVVVRTSPPLRAIPTDTGRWFVAGLADRGPLTAVYIQSLQQFINVFGGRQTYSVLYDAVEAFFREGGSGLYVSRVVGPAPVIAFVNLLDAGAATSLIVKAKGPGAYANTLRVSVAAGVGAGTFTLTVSDTVLGVLESSGDLANQAAAVGWSQQSSYVDIALGASANNPANIVNAALATGADDRLNVTDVQWKGALDRFNKDLGPGQVTQIGRTTAQAYADTLAHAAANNRVAVLDAPDSPTVATVQAAATALRNTNDEYGAMFGPWAVIPGLTPNTTRIVPPSAIVAAKASASDGLGNSPNVPAAGSPEGICSYVIGLSQPAYDNGSGQDVTRDAMYAAGVNLIVYRYGVFEVFGWRTLVDPNGSKQDWVNLGNRRLAMAIVAEALALAENYILDEVTPFTIKRYHGDLDALISRYWELGSLYGDRPEDAFVVDTGPNVNTAATIQNKELHAAIGLRMTQDAELVVIDIAKVPVNQSLSTV